MQLAKGVRQREKTYLVALKEEAEDEFLDVPEEVLPVLDDFGNVMPLELPKKLPLRREVDHVIKLEPGLKELYGQKKVLAKAVLEV